MTAWYRVDCSIYLIVADNDYHTGPPNVTHLPSEMKCARGGKVVLYKNGTDSLHVSVFVRKRSFFLQFGLPSTHIHWKRSPKTCLLKTVENAVLLYSSGWVKTKFFVKTITCTSRCWIPVNVNAPIKDCTEPLFIHYCVFVWTSEND